MRGPWRSPNDDAPAAGAAIYVSSEELASLAGVSVTRIERLVALGVLEPDAPGAQAFSAATASRLRRMLRLHADLDVNFRGASIIVDLLERLERLERDLEHRR
jgi:chaperone modulatory protein CbpM